MADNSGDSIADGFPFDYQIEQFELRPDSVAITYMDLDASTGDVAHFRTVVAPLTDRIEAPLRDVLHRICGLVNDIHELSQPDMPARLRRGADQDDGR